MSISIEKPFTHIDSVIKGAAQQLSFPIASLSTTTAARLRSAVWTKRISRCCSLWSTHITTTTCTAISITYSMRHIVAQPVHLVLRTMGAGTGVVAALGAAVRRTGFVQDAQRRLHRQSYPDLNPERGAFFDELRTKVPVHVTQGQYWTIFPQSEIVINQTVKRDVNFRVFEAMMCGTLPVDGRIENGCELFRDGEHLVTYEKNNTSDAADKIRYYLRSPRRSATIAAADAPRFSGAAPSGGIARRACSRTRRARQGGFRSEVFVGDGQLHNPGAPSLHSKKIGRAAMFSAYVESLAPPSWRWR